MRTNGHASQGILLYEIYGPADAVCAPPSARELAQELAPETYPRNCQQVLDGLAGMAKLDLVERLDIPDDSLRPTSRVRLASGVLDELLSCLARDPINDADVGAARRQQAVSDTWPL